jgi:hypothetical protein
MSTCHYEFLNCVILNCTTRPSVRDSFLGNATAETCARHGEQTQLCASELHCRVFAYVGKTIITCEDANAFSYHRMSRNLIASRYVARITPQTTSYVEGEREEILTTKVLVSKAEAGCSRIKAVRYGSHCSIRRSCHGWIRILRILEGVPQLAFLTRHVRIKQMGEKYHDFDKA